MPLPAYEESARTPLSPVSRQCMGVLYAVSTTGNIEGLQLSLLSVIMQTVRPEAILVRWEGDGAPFNNYYFAQIAAFARLKGIEFTTAVASSNGIRAARDAMLRYASSRRMVLWMGDDDVVFAPHCLEALLEAYQAHGDAGFIVGNKPDITNSRGYPDFRLDSHDSFTAKDEAGYNFLYHGANNVVKVSTCDTGNVLINALKCEEKGVTFQPFDKACNAGGEDTLFAAVCASKGLQGYFATRADSYHLEKQGGARFGEFAARKQLVMRELDMLKLPPAAGQHMMPAIPVFPRKV